MDDDFGIGPLGNGDRLALDLADHGFTNLVRIGEGGFGVVYRAFQPVLGRQVAVKVLSTQLDGLARARFAREGQALGRLAGHPNIVAVHSVGLTTSGRPFLVMAYIAHGALADRITRSGALDWRSGLRVGIRLCGAVETAHRSGVIHRDIKPENVLMSDYDEPLLADFGIALVQHGFETSDGRMTASIEHAAPEVLDGVAGTVASDVYSLGSTLHALLAGRSPFARTGDEPLAGWYVRIARQSPPDLSLSEVPVDVARCVAWALEKDPADRPVSAAVFGEALQEAATRCGAPPTQMAVGEGVEVPDGDGTGPPPALPTTDTPADLAGAGLGGSHRRVSVRTRVLVVVVVVAVAGLSVGVWALARGRSINQRLLTEVTSAPAANGSNAVVLQHDAVQRSVHIRRGATFEEPFMVTVGQRVTGTVRASVAPTSPVAVSVVQPDGSPIAETSLADTQIRIDPVAVVIAGVHRLRIGPADDDLDITTELELAPVDVTASAVLDGNPVTVALVEPRQRALVSVSATPGRSVRVTWTWSGPDPLYTSLSVLGIEPRVGWSALATDASPAFVVGPSGTFVVQVVIDSDATGTGEVQVRSS